MKPRLALFAVSAALGASACNPADDATSAARPQIELPTIAAGKWQVRLENDGRSWGGPPDIRCYLERTLWDVMEVGVASLSSCRRAIEKNNAGYVAKYRCKSGGSDITITATISGKLDSHFRMESIQTFKPALSGTDQQTIAVQAERHGACDPA